MTLRYLDYSSRNAFIWFYAGSPTMRRLREHDRKKGAGIAVGYCRRLLMLPRPSTRQLCIV